MEPSNSAEVMNEISLDDIWSDVHLEHYRIGKVAYEGGMITIAIYAKSIPMRHCDVLCRHCLL